jgi:hypothetical protein
MSVENDPMFNKWLAAIDGLKAAADDYRSALRNGESPDGVRAARATLAMAQAAYDRVSQDIDGV